VHKLKEELSTLKSVLSSPRKFAKFQAKLRYEEIETLNEEILKPIKITKAKRSIIHLNKQNLKRKQSKSSQVYNAVHHSNFNSNTSQSVMDQYRGSESVNRSLNRTSLANYYNSDKNESDMKDMKDRKDKKDKKDKKDRNERTDRTDRTDRNGNGSKTNSVNSSQPPTQRYVEKRSVSECPKESSKFYGLDLSNIRKFELNQQQIASKTQLENCFSDRDEGEENSHSCMSTSFKFHGAKSIKPPEIPKMTFKKSTKLSGISTISINKLQELNHLNKLTRRKLERNTNFLPAVKTNDSYSSKYSQAITSPASTLISPTNLKTPKQQAFVLKKKFLFPEDLN
jgi:hypothetical protein